MQQKVYELVIEEPMDFRSYLCQGIICTLLRNKDEAEKKSEQFEKLVPKNHLKKTPEVTKSGNVWVTNCFLQSLSILNPQLDSLNNVLYSAAFICCNSIKNLLVLFFFKYSRQKKDSNDAWKLFDEMTMRDNYFLGN